MLADSASSGRSSSTSAVNQPLPGEQAMPPALPVMQEAANRALPYPYQEDEIRGGDSVLSIQRRLLGGFPSPSAHDIQMARIQAEDLFEVKVDIIRKMTGLHPSGDWMGRGARALDNLRTATGEESLSRLHQMLDTGNLQSATFWLLVERVPLRADVDQHSANSPLELFQIIPFLPIMLLTLSLVLLLVYFVTKKGVEKKDKANES